MTYVMLSETSPVARKDHRCIWCGENIPKGSKYVAERSVFDGEMQNHHWHVECIADCRRSNDEEYEDEFTPFENERPKESA